MRDELAALEEGEETTLELEEQLGSAGNLNINTSRRCREIYNRVRTAGRPGYTSFAEGEREALAAEDTALGCNVFTDIVIGGRADLVFPKDRRTQGDFDGYIGPRSSTFVFNFDTTTTGDQSLESPSIGYPFEVVDINIEGSAVAAGGETLDISVSGHGRIFHRQAAGAAADVSFGITGIDGVASGPWGPPITRAGERITVRYIDNALSSALNVKIHVREINPRLFI